MVVFLFSAGLTSCSSTKPGKGSNGPASIINVNDAFKAVYEATQQVLAEVKNETLKLEGIDLSFATTISTEASGEIKLYVVSGKYSRSWSNSRKTSYSFGERANNKKALVADPKNSQFKAYLIAAIIGSQNIKDIGNFGLKEVVVEVEFTIKNAIEGGVEFEILPVGASVSVSREKEAVHTITLKFSRK